MALALVVSAQAGTSDFPDFKLRDTKGKEWNRAGLTPGKTYLFEFWATWCVSCKKLSPIIDELYAKHRDSGFEVLAVSVDSDMQTLQKQIRESPKPFPILLDPRSELLGKLKSRSVPTLVLVKDGKVLGRWTGLVSKETLDKAIVNSRKG